MNRATCVICEGPFPDVDRCGEEIPVWFVSLADDDGDTICELSTCYSYDAAITAAKSLAKSRRLELVMEATHA